MAHTYIALEASDNLPTLLLLLPPSSVFMCVSVSHTQFLLETRRLSTWLGLSGTTAAMLQKLSRRWGPFFFYLQPRGGNQKLRLSCVPFMIGLTDIISVRRVHVSCVFPPPARPPQSCHSFFRLLSSSLPRLPASLGDWLLPGCVTVWQHISCPFNIYRTLSQKETCTLLEISLSLYTKIKK